MLPGGVKGPLAEHLKRVNMSRTWRQAKAEFIYPMH